MYHIIITFLIALQYINAQVPIPGRPPGFPYGTGSPEAGVILEAYVDLLCPDCKQAYPALKNIAEHYNDPMEFRLQFVLFPLPYHQHAFTAAEAAYTITNALGTETFIPWLEAMFYYQDQFWNEYTKDMTPVQVTDQLQGIAQYIFPSLTDEQWKKGMSGYGGTDADDQARVSWKYTCTRGMSGTPMYTLNGVPINADALWTVEKWKKLLDPLIKGNRAKWYGLPVYNQHVNDMMEDNGKPKAPPKPCGHPLEAVAFQVSAKREDVHIHEPQMLLASVCVDTPGGRPCEYTKGVAQCCIGHDICVMNTGCV